MGRAPNRTVAQTGFCSDPVNLDGPDGVPAALEPAMGLAAQQGLWEEVGLGGLRGPRRQRPRGHRDRQTGSPSG